MGAWIYTLWWQRNLKSKTVWYNAVVCAFPHASELYVGVLHTNFFGTKYSVGDCLQP